jgi:hypothetical protein
MDLKTDSEPHQFGVDQPYPNAALGPEPVRTIAREELDAAVVSCLHVDCRSSVALYRDLVARAPG